MVHLNRGVYAYIFTWSFIGFVGHTESFVVHGPRRGVHVLYLYIGAHVRVGLIVDSPPLLSVPISNF